MIRNQDKPDPFLHSEHYEPERLRRILSDRLTELQAAYDRINDLQSRLDKSLEENALLQHRAEINEWKLSIQEGYATSRLCSGHQGHWSRGTCVLCDLERAQSRLDTANQQLVARALQIDELEHDISQAVKGRDAEANARIATERRLNPCLDVLRRLVKWNKSPPVPLKVDEKRVADVVGMMQQLHEIATDAEALLSAPSAPSEGEKP